MKGAKKIYYLIGASILLIFSNTIIFLQQSSTNDKNFYSAKKTHEIIESANALISFIRNAEVQQQSYLVTSDTSYLSVFNNAIKRVHGQRIAFYSLLITNRFEKYNTTRINELIKHKVAYMRQAVDLKVPGQDSISLSILKHNDGHILMDSIVTQLTVVIVKEKQALTNKIASIERLNYRIQVFSIISNWMLLVIVVFGLLNIMSNKEQIEKLFLQIRKKNTMLEEQHNQLQLLSHNLLQQNNELERFAHVASHDLRSPAANLSALLHLYSVSKTAEERQELIETMNAVSKNLESKLNDLVEIIRAKNDTGRLDENVSIQEVYNKVIKNLSTAIQETDANMMYDFAEPDKLNVSKSYLESILQNLISNSLRYRHPERRPIITIKSFFSDGHNYIRLSDNGMGIDLKKHGEDLFGLYKTFHKNKDSKGVGLYITKAQVLAMGGTIDVESEPGKGTAFTIRL